MWYFLSDAVELAQEHSGHTGEGKGREEGDEAKEGNVPPMEDDLENDLSGEEACPVEKQGGRWRQREEHLQSGRGPGVCVWCSLRRGWRGVRVEGSWLWPEWERLEG